MNEKTNELQIKFSYLVLGKNEKEIAESMNLYFRVIELAVKDYGLTRSQQKEYANLDMRKRLALFEIERRVTLYSKYLTLESTLLSAIEDYMQKGEGSRELSAQDLSRLANTLQVLRQPMYKEEVKEDVVTDGVLVSYEERALRAQKELKALREARGGDKRV